MFLMFPYVSNSGGFVFLMFPYILVELYSFLFACPSCSLCSCFVSDFSTFFRLPRGWGCVCVYAPNKSDFVVFYIVSRGSGYPGCMIQYLAAQVPERLYVLVLIRVRCYSSWHGATFGFQRHLSVSDHLSGTMRPTLGNILVLSAELGPIPAKFGPVPAKCSRLRSTSDPSWQTRGHARPTSARSRPTLDRVLPPFRQCRSKLDQRWPSFEQRLLNLAEFG